MKMNRRWIVLAACAAMATGAAAQAPRLPVKPVHIVAIVAPGLFSTTVGWPRRDARPSPSIRATASALPPGATMTTMWTGFTGN
ncbi:MAG: hypothetical protein EOO24_47625, partial [Comamonadaceae bacterium]